MKEKSLRRRRGIWAVTAGFLTAASSSSSRSTASAAAAFAGSIASASTRFKASLPSSKTLPFEPSAPPYPSKRCAPGTSGRRRLWAAAPRKDRNLGNGGGSERRRRIPSFRNKKSSKNNRGSSDSTDTDERDSSPWLRWMICGKPRGTNKVILREAAELGGVPRSDRYSSRDWFHNTMALPNSAILRDIRSPVLAVTSWATFLSLLHAKLLKTGRNAAASRMHLPSLAPHSLTMSALGLLLVFRTNSAYQRFNEGRKIWETIINTSRDLYRMLVLYEDEVGSRKRRRLQRLLAAFPYLLRHRIRPNKMHRLNDEQHRRDPENSILLYQDHGVVLDTDPEAAAVANAEEETGKSRRRTRPLFWVDKRTLPWRLLPDPSSLADCARAQNRPLWVCDRMSYEIRQVPDQPQFAARERLTMIGLVHKLSRCIGGSERIHQTVVPLNYARHTLRALTLWLFSLPFAVLKDLKLLTGPVLFLVSWLLFGVYEIGYSIEDPFQGTLRLSILCDTIRRDVLADESVRSTAFRSEQRPPPIYPDPDDDDAEGAVFRGPAAVVARNNVKSSPDSSLPSSSPSSSLSGGGDDNAYQ